MLCKLESEPLRARDGTWTVTVSGLPQEVLKVFDSLRGKPTDVEFKVHRDKRSLDANAYFHLLAGKIASVIGSSLEDVKRDLVLDYGVMQVDAYGSPIIIQIPDSLPPEAIYPYTRYVGRMLQNGQVIRQFAIYKRTHEMDTKEFSDLIEGVIYEAQELDIETITPEEKGRMMESYERRYGKKLDEQEYFAG